VTPYQRRVAWLFILCSIVILLEAQLKSHRATAGVLIQMGAAWFLSICVHEAGHASGAALVRFRVRVGWHSALQVISGSGWLLAGRMGRIQSAGLSCGIT
jgi:hypothetical protein